MLDLRPLLSAAALALLGSCASVATMEMEPADGLDFLATCLTGTFDSVAQAEAEPEYFAIQLRSFPVWTERADGPWIYVEQAAVDQPPYRQRVYHLSITSGGYRSVIYALPGDPLEFAGARSGDPRFDELRPSDLVERVGCAVDLELLLLDGRPGFVGSTAERACESDRNGATYATSLVTLTGDLLESWDRGFDADDEQVWGAEQGPYRFVRQPGTAPLPAQP